MSLSLILPTLNERENIERFVPELLAGVPEISEVIVVDDGSEDGTQQVTERLATEDPRVRLLRRVGRPCLTAAIQEGILASTSELVSWMDADLVLRPADVRRLVAAVQRGADVAVGSRFAAGGRIKGQLRDGLTGRVAAIRNLRTTEDPWTGVFLSWLLNTVVLPPLVGLGVRDYTSGIIVARRRALTPIRLRGDHGEYFVQLWADLMSAGLEVVEVPYRIQPRLYGRSKTGNDVFDYARRGVRYLAAGLDARRTLLTRRRRT